jgi:hypothetical protein
MKPRYRGGSTTVPDEIVCTGLMPSPVHDHSNLGRSQPTCEAMTSSCGEGEGRASLTACPSQLPRTGCAELVHELSNLMTGVLVNAQVLQWKLPPYSHFKRPLREMERNAQRGSELLKALMRRCAEPDPQTSIGTPKNQPVPDGIPARVAADLTRACDSRTSGVFPKRDDSNGPENTSL